MDKNNFHKHICNNTRRNIAREGQNRIKNEGLELEITPRREENYYDDENKYYTCDYCDIRCKNEQGSEIYVTNIYKDACSNRNYRESIWTGEYLQATLMSIPCGDDIGVEVHHDTDQYIRVEYGNAILVSGGEKHHLCERKKLRQGDVVFIPAGVWHNIINAGRYALKISSIYAPPHHLRCTVEKHK